ncbi:MAG: hypothetical protein JWO89_3785 [Verrucomicrobiaceae bacterium]|nr:hypothetical protein [Verrucomicrobiaceae bacterium]
MGRAGPLHFRYINTNYNICYNFRIANTQQNLLINVKLFRLLKQFERTNEAFTASKAPAGTSQKCLRR